MRHPTATTKFARNAKTEIDWRLIDMSDCRCIVYHPQTDEEMKLVKNVLKRARKAGDLPGIQLAIAQLTGKCLSKLDVQQSVSVSENTHTPTF